MKEVRCPACGGSLYYCKKKKSINLQKMQRLGVTMIKICQCEVCVICGKNIGENPGLYHVYPYDVVICDECFRNPNKQEIDTTEEEQ